MRIAVASGKGGTGKTLVSTNLFSILSGMGYRVSLVDCDAEAPNSVALFDVKLVGTTEVNHKVPVIDTNRCTFCGQCQEFCNYNAIFLLPPVKVIQVMEDLCHGCNACSVACPHSAITEKEVSVGQVKTFSYNGKPSITEARMNIGVMSPVPVIKRAIGEADPQSDFILLDSPPGTSCPFVQTVASANFVVLVTEPTPFGLSDLRQSVETLREMGKPCGVVINRAGMGNGMVHEYLEKVNIPLLGEIPFDKKIAEYYSKGVLVHTQLHDVKKLLVHILKMIDKSYGNSSSKR